MKPIHMTAQSGEINRDVLIVGLADTLDATQYAIQEVSSGEYDENGDLALGVVLSHALDHLIVAWHQKAMTPDDILRESQEEYEAKATSIINWGGDFRLLEMVDILGDPVFSIPSADDKWHSDTIVSILRQVEAMLQNLISDLENGGFAPLNSSGLAPVFRQVMQKVCLAWHARRCSTEEFASLTAEKRHVWESTIPKWDYRNRLVEA